MTNFNFDFTANISQNSFAALPGNEIHTVTFKGCEARDCKNKDTGAEFKVLDIKFGNDAGTFTHTAWEPQESDFKDTEGPYGPQPSHVTQMMLVFKHLIDAVNPELAKEINAGKTQIKASSWDALRNFMVENTAKGIGTETKIKLIKNKKGEAIFPYCAAYSRAGQLYMTTNFIGKNIFWSAKELKKIETANQAQATPVSDVKNSDPFAAPIATATAQESTEAAPIVNEATKKIFNMDFELK